MLFRKGQRSTTVPMCGLCTCVVCVCVHIIMHSCVCERENKRERLTVDIVCACVQERRRFLRMYYHQLPVN